MPIPIYNRTKSEQTFISHGNIFTIPAGSDREPGMTLVSPRVAADAARKHAHMLTLDRNQAVGGAQAPAITLPLDALADLSKTDLHGVIAWLGRKQLTAKHLGDLEAAQLADLARKLAEGQPVQAAFDSLFEVPTTTPVEPSTTDAGDKPAA